MKLFLLALLTVATAAAAPVTVMVNSGLVYVRVHALPADLPPSNALAHHAWIVDLRYVKAGAEEAALLDSWVRVNATTATPVFLLANPETSAAVLLPFQSHTIPGLITVGRRKSGFAVDITVRTKAETERTAYDALEHGATVAALTTDFPGKPRIDEEKLTREHLQDVQAPDEPEEDPKHPTPPPPLIDAVLQRAVHLDEGLIALKKL